MHNFKELKVWQKSIDLVVDIYRTTENFPKEEIFGITSQSRRAAVSIPCNIAEGAGKTSKKDFSRFLEIANGSCNELETLQIIAKKLELIKDIEEYQSMDNNLQEIRKMIQGLKKSMTI